MNNKSVDIIIPIYNAADDLELCLESIYKHTDLERNRLVLINDNSPDPRIKEILGKQTGKNIIVIHNEKNQGFSANINLGMAQSEENDVILLNSDTVVTERWVEKMAQCANSDTIIGIVCPLSNNATICSVPDSYENLDISLDEINYYAEVTEKSSAKKYPRITVANGFCMYIKREVIKSVGEFDSETFGVGYGEENDYCYRANQLGYFCVMCDDTFIYHSGTKSFVSNDKKNLIEKHEKILWERYPIQSNETHIEMLSKPNEMINDSFKRCFNILNSKKNLLYVLQSDFKKEARDNVGGTQFHVKNLMDCMRGINNVIVAARNGDKLNVTLYTENNEFAWTYYIGHANAYQQFSSIKMAQLWGNILDSFCIDCVHVHHLKGLTYDVVYESKKRNIPVVFTCHDYYVISPSYNLLDENNRVIDTSVTNDKVWNDTLNRRLGISEKFNYITIWKAKNQELLNLCERIIVPNVTCKELIGNYYDNCKGKIEVIEHGYDRDMIDAKSQKKNKKRLQVAFIGGISEEKGASEIVKLIKGIDSEEVEWHIFGLIGTTDLLKLHRKNLTKHGVYEVGQLKHLLDESGIDLVCLFSICPETYSYTLSEAVICGRPVIVTNLGALGERVSRLNCGWTVNVENIFDEVHSLIKDIIHNKELLNEKRKVSPNAIRSLDDMKKDYIRLYDNLSYTTQHKKINAEFLYSGIEHNDPLASCGLKTEQLEVLNSLTYKMVCNLRRIPIPFKVQLWQILHRLGNNN